MALEVIRCVVKGTILGTVETRNMFDWGCDTSSLQEADYTALVAKTDTMFTIIRDFLSNKWNGYQVDTYRRSEGEWVFHQGYVSGAFGNSGVDFNSFQSAILFVARTAVKRAIGKKFIPGITDTNVVLGALAPAAIAACLDFAASWLTPVTGSGTNVWAPGIVSKNSAFAPFLDVGVSNILSTWRKRKPQYGI